MDFFKSGLKSVLGGPPEGVQPTGAETVERLVDRVQSSTLLDDRRDACRALKALSRKYRVEVGAQGMTALRQVLEADRADAEIVGYALDTLCNITSPETFEEEERPDGGGNVGEQFTEMFLKRPDAIPLILAFLDEYDFHVRWPALKLLSAVLSNKPREVQDAVLVSPMGVSKLMDLLGDAREVIRNNALLLLIQLTKGNANIQKIVAFENAFDRLLDVVTEEGGVDGGIIVEDCLLLMLNLLRSNTSNMNFFKEGGYIQRLAPMLSLPSESDEVGWSPQKVSNVHCILQVVRTLVNPSNPAQIISSSQKHMRSCGLVDSLCSLLMASGVPADVLAETICTVGEVVRGCTENQEMLAAVMAPSTPPRPALVVLLMSMVNEKQPFSLRLAVLYCFQCYLYRNEHGQAQLVQTLLPASADVGQLTPGQLLCGGLFSPDPLSHWLVAVALSHVLLDSPAQKEQLLRVLLATGGGRPPVPLLQQLSNLLQTANSTHTRLGLLQLLSGWLAHCPSAVAQFLSAQSSISHLMAQVSAPDQDEHAGLVQGACAFLLGLCVAFNDGSASASGFDKATLRQLIERRVGLELFLERLSTLSRHEAYGRASKHPQARAAAPYDLLLDHEFCRLLRTVVKAVTPAPGELDGADGSGDSETSPVQLDRYKQLIRDQDARLNEMAASHIQLQQERDALQARLDELVAANQLLRDENTLLRARANAHAGEATTNSNDGIHVAELTQRLAALTADSHNKEQRIRDLEQQLESSPLKSNDIERTSADSQEVADLQAELSRLRKDQDDLLELLADQDARLTTFRQRLRDLGEKVEDDDEDDDDGDDISTGDEEEEEEEEEESRRREG
ncbi:General vesicular transport factor p115 [Gryllus bimaculatus]|nr:General vesicular transport factor p115 [Gryllus bimaculatus]